MMDPFWFDECLFELREMVQQLLREPGGKVENAETIELLDKAIMAIAIMRNKRARALEQRSK